MSYRDCNSQISSCMYSSDFSKNADSWPDQLYSARISATDDDFSKEMKLASNKQPLREKNRKNNAYRHVPHKRQATSGCCTKERKRTKKSPSCQYCLCAIEKGCTNSEY
ncbi:hypothetical protein NQ314_008407 [Rhamnusium bicolor]|uniref:Uncharacterized protein n=1 Tax=Rhamnusium bicolor TaxID=1586634 RepID=A0AAV8YD38_9CUCU|nr:hypothetical protein NQ314_008407 [Rhamnusium bicolor]